MNKKELDVIIQLAKLRLYDLKANKHTYMALALLTQSSSSIEELSKEANELISNLESVIPKLEHMKRIARE